MTKPHGANPYTGFAARLKPGSRGMGGTDALNEAPDEMEDLPEYFLALEPRRLAGSWVAAVVSASRREFTTGDICRTLIVVAERLHDIKLPPDFTFEEFIMPHVPAPPPTPHDPTPHRRPAASTAGDAAPPGLDRDRWVLGAGRSPAGAQVRPRQRPRTAPAALPPHGPQGAPPRRRAGVRRD